MSYEIQFTDDALDDIQALKMAGKLNKIAKLLDEIEEHPYTGSGQIELLKYELSGLVSRRINDFDRLTYKVIEDEQKIVIYRCKDHYANIKFHN